MDADSLVATLRLRWDSALQGSKASPAELQAVFSDLRRRYSEAHRHYHNLNHLTHVLDVLASQEASAAVQLAAWFHDAVYEPRATDNEEQSAALAIRDLARLRAPARTCKQIEGWILATKTHDVAADDAEGRLLLDADLSILEAERPEYVAYAEAIRREFGFVPDSEFRSGRIAVLESFLGRPRIYLTPALYEKRETSARANLTWEIQSLSSQS